MAYNWLMMTSSGDEPKSWKSTVFTFVKRLVFFRFVGNYIQTSADDVPLGQLSSPDDVIISQLLTSTLNN